MVSAAALNARFGIADALVFREHVDAAGVASGLVALRVVTGAAEAELFVQGAHLTRWVAAGEKPGIYLSPASQFAVGKAIRGGIPVLFPWFGDGWDGQHTPAHGFARVSEWMVESTGLNGAGVAEVTLSLGPNEASRAAGYDDFHLGIQFRIGRVLEISLEVTNHGAAAMVFEEGLHTYFAVGDIRQVAVEGLEGTTYVDKRDGGVRKVQRERMLRFARDVDQVHVRAAGPVTVHDAAWGRRMLLEKVGSQTTVTWNPWSVLTPGLPDLPADSWEHFVCVEAVNAGDDRLTLGPGETHRMDARMRMVGGAA